MQRKRSSRRIGFENPWCVLARSIMFHFLVLSWNLVTSRATSPAFYSASSSTPMIGRSTSSAAHFGMRRRRRRRRTHDTTRSTNPNYDSLEYDHMSFLLGHRGGVPSHPNVAVVRGTTFHRDRRSTRRLVGENHHKSDSENDHDVDDTITTTVRFCSVAKTLLRGAALRIASDLSGGTPLENIKTRTTLMSTESPLDATRNIVQADGLFGLWKGSPSRTIEGALIGAVFMFTSGWTKTQLKHLGTPPTVAALAGGLVGGVAQAAIMTPCGLIFTALNSQKQQQQQQELVLDGYTKSTLQHESSLDIVRRVIRERGIGGMYAGLRPMALRQATNWASRAGFTEITRSVLGWSQYGLIGELASGAVGGVGSCWNTPIETIRVYTQRDVNQGNSPKTMGTYWNEIVQTDGYAGLFRGYKPRAIQAIWQTTFLIVVPNILGI